ncbi:MAG: M3 family metallopeptidase [Bacteroidales bacterium]
MIENPLLLPFEGEFEAPPFHLINENHYLPAFKTAIEKGRERIEAICSNKESPNFQNTVLALEFAGRELMQTASIFFNLNSAHTNDHMESIALAVSPLISAYSSEVLLNRTLFKKVESLYLNREKFNLTQEELRLIEQSYLSFVRNGAKLSKKRDRERLSEINSELSTLSLQFGQNLLASTNNFVLHLTSHSQLEGLSNSFIASAASEAKERSLDGWVITLHQPSYTPFMQQSTNRALRERLWRAYNSRALSGEYDNKAIISKIVKLRAERASLLGYESHAQYVLEENMAKSPKRVEEFLNSLLNKALPPAKKEVTKIEDFAKEKGFKGEFMPWDFGYWAEQYKKEYYSIDDETIKPYFQLEKVEGALFYLAKKLWGLKFTPAPQEPKYESSVKVFEVSDSSGAHLALLYIDYFSRASKRGGAWMTNYREQHLFEGRERRAIVSLVLNFPKPTEETPSLLTFNHLTTLLHEFGHALHSIFAEGSFPSLTGTNVVRDFVELPSQIMENWGYEAQFLNSFATHYKSGEAIPQEIIERLRSARNFLSGYNTVRQLGFGLCDIAWHTLQQGEEIEDPIQFEELATSSVQLFPKVEGSAISTSFSHIFAGGYSAGYYSYKWAEVLEADAFSLFLERGIYNKEVAASFRENILSKGNLEDAALLFKKFRGRDPIEEPFLKKFGLE